LFAVHLFAWLIGLTLTLLMFCAPANAAIAQPDRVLLTLERLQERIRNPQPREGTRIVDLQRFTIDLRPENAAFREQFYELLRPQLQRSGIPIGLDLSYSQIQGEFQMSLLGLRAPLYGQSLSPIFSATEQTQLQRDRRLLARLSTLSQSLLATPNLGNQASSLQITVFRGPLKLTQTRFLGAADFTNTFFLNRLEAQGAQFLQGSDWVQSRFSQTASFSGAVFDRDTRFRSSIFFSRAEFNQAQFQGETNFQSSEFQGTANFNQALFQQPATFLRTQFQRNADFAQAHWQNTALFTKSSFNKSLFLTDAIFEKAVMFRDVRFNDSVNLRGASILEKADFGYADFAKGAYLNVPGMRFDSDRAKIVGNPGQISRVLSVPTLQGNENLLRELVRNFRKQEQIPDANRLDYTRERLRLRELRQQVFGINVNSAPIEKLVRLGFSSEQASTIAGRRLEQPFRSLTELLTLGNVDIATYINVRDRLVAKSTVLPGREVFNRIATGINWIGLSLLLLLSHYGTNFWLVFGVGLVAIGYFGVLFWLIDRWRRVAPDPILPTLPETLCVLATFSLLTSAGFVAIFRTADRPWLSLTCLGILILPIPLALMLWLYRVGRYHPLMNVSYFTEEGTLRQLRIVVGRLPVIPRFPEFRQRYMPIIWKTRWNWLNYFDFSLNNLLRLGFNDIRLRDEHLPGLITALVWYEWSLGVLYFSLLLWTLSRTIPGLNLLLYFK
jgi:hypothetical protein